MNKKKRNSRLLVISCVVMGLLSGCGASGRDTGISILLEENAEAVSADTGGATGAPVNEETASGLSKEQTTGEVASVFVHICGEVISPGVYEVAADSRIYEVLMLAGGFTEEAVQTAVNLALPVSDGMQVIIPSLDEWEEADRQAEREKEGLVNINTATADKLCELPGIGESRAADIIAYREAQGGFSSPEEIMQVAGIKEAMYEKLKDYIYVE